MTSLQVEIKTVDESPNYIELNKNGENWKELTLEKAIVVKKGTVEGNATVDLQLKDSDGNKFIVFIKGSHLRNLGIIVNEHMVTK